ncbi:hypothetical protein, partial [Dactylosporangium cerinum]
YKYKEIAREVVKEKFALLATSFALSQRSFFGEIIDNMKQSIIAHQPNLLFFQLRMRKRQQINCRSSLQVRTGLVFSCFRILTPIIVKKLSTSACQ